MSVSNDERSLTPCRGSETRVGWLTVKAIEKGGYDQKCFYFILRDSFRCCAILLGLETFLVIKFAGVFFVKDNSMKVMIGIWGSAVFVCYTDHLVTVKSSHF